MKKQYFESDYEDLDWELLKTEVVNDPAFKNIISGLWKMKEELDELNKIPGRPQKNMQDVVNFFRKSRKESFAAMRAEWRRACGKPMTIEQEKLAFESPKIKVKIAKINMLQDYMEHIHKANEIAKLFGLEPIGPITRSRQTSGWGKGGNERAKVAKEKVQKLRSRCVSFHAEIKRRNSNLSDNAIDMKVASKIGKSPNYVYKLRKNKT